MKRATYTFSAADTAAVCQSQTKATSGALTLNGTLVDGPSTMTGVPYVKLPGIQRNVSLTSSGNLSAQTFTVNGSDLTGSAIGETLSGPNNNTVSTTGQFNKVTGVSSNSGVGTGVLVGTGPVGKTNWFIVDYYISPPSIYAEATITSTANIDVQYTPDDVQTVVSPTTFKTISGASTSSDATMSSSVGAVRGVVNSSSGATSAVTFNITQAGW